MSLKTEFVFFFNFFSAVYFSKPIKTLLFLNISLLLQSFSMHLVGFLFFVLNPDLFALYAGFFCHVYPIIFHSLFEVFFQAVNLNLFPPIMAQLISLSTLALALPLQLIAVKFTMKTWLQQSPVTHFGRKKNQAHKQTIAATIAAE